jgi:DNA-binding transcriptional MocR family regulator
MISLLLVQRNLISRCPKGGYFIWIEILYITEIDCRKIFEEFKRQKVVVLEGRPFYNAYEKLISRPQCFRLSYSYLSRENIAEGIKRIATIIQGFSNMNTI